MPVTENLFKAPQPPSTQPTMTKIIRPSPTQTAIPVAGYARVSTELECQDGSFHAQIEHLRHTILNTSGWKLFDIYGDDGLTGRRMERPAMQRLLRDCRNGSVKIVLTKSISRFGRNTADLITAVREFKALGVRIIFEKERLDTDKMGGELLLTLLSAFAEYESESIRRNVSWGYRKRMEKGEYYYKRPPYGYDSDSGELKINESEATVVTRIYDLYIAGCGCTRIARILNDECMPTKNGGHWSGGTVRAILSNITYTGDVIWQKTKRRYTADGISIQVASEMLPIRDEMVGRQKTKDDVDHAAPIYIPRHHTAIISMATFKEAAAMMAGRI